MGKEFQKSALPTLFHFVRVRAALQPHVEMYQLSVSMCLGGTLGLKIDVAKKNFKFLEVENYNSMYVVVWQNIVFVIQVEAVLTFQNIAH